MVHQKHPKKHVHDFPDLSAMTHEEILDTCIGSADWYNWTTTAREDSYHEQLFEMTKAEILRRMA